jgi:hypothetical protein
MDQMGSTREVDATDDDATTRHGILTYRNSLLLLGLDQVTAQVVADATARIVSSTVAMIIVILVYQLVRWSLAFPSLIASLSHRPSSLVSQTAALLTMSATGFVALGIFIRTSNWMMMSSLAQMSIRLIKFATRFFFFTLRFFVFFFFVFFAN